MHPSSLTLRNFRSFGGPEGIHIELRPLTLLFGKNNSGKSSLLRALPLVADSLAGAGLDALNFDGRFRSFDLDFESIRWKGRLETDEHTIGIGLEWKDANFRIDWTLNEHAEWRRLIVERLSIIQADGKSLTADWKLRREDSRDSDLLYEISHGETKKDSVLPFSGLLPAPGILPEEISTFQSYIQNLGESVLWLRSQRAATWRYTRWRGSIRRDISPNGQDASVVLAGDTEIKNEVSRWYAEHIGYDLVVEEIRKREVRTLLRNRTKVSFDVDLIDTGEGVTQALSALTALAMVRRHKENGKPSILALEEPEDHLHPDLQRAIAEQICGVVADTAPLVILETHSEHILLTVRLQIVKGLLRSDDVVVYWVGRSADGRSYLNKIYFDSNGNFIGDWPPDAFQENISLAADISDARLEPSSR